MKINIHCVSYQKKYIVRAEIAISQKLVFFSVSFISSKYFAKSDLKSPNNVNYLILWSGRNYWNTAIWTNRENFRGICWNDKECNFKDVKSIPRNRDYYVRSTSPTSPSAETLTHKQYLMFNARQQRTQKWYSAAKSQLQIRSSRTEGGRPNSPKVAPSGWPLCI